MPSEGSAEMALPPQDPGTRDQWYGALNRTSRPYPRDCCIHACFETEVDLTPDALAIDDEGMQLSYRDLDGWANALAHDLIGSGVHPGDLVGMFLERSVEAIVAQLAILKAGAAYLPLDPHHPCERINAVVADAGAVLVLMRDGLGRAGILDGMKTMVVRPRPPLPGRIHRPAARVGATDLAYVMYTSGSTGRPKGVEITHRGVVRLVLGTDYAHFAGETFLQLAPLAFDASTFEIWGALLNGCRLVIMPALATPAMIRRVVQSKGVTTLWLTAGLFQVFSAGPWEELRGLRQLLSGGDVLPVPHVRRIREGLPGCRLINGYGPTENTTFTCCHTVMEPLGTKVPIGRPIAQTTVHILDDALHPVSHDEMGEICTGGDGLARGYRNRPELTAERFIPDPFGPPGGRLYRTGDLGRWRTDGTIEFCGRLDLQVKIRGNRVEPGEVEHALLGHPDVREALVMAHGVDATERQLIAYVVAAAEAHPTWQQIRKFLDDRLPAFMIPSDIVFLAVMPLTANGKIDRAALPAPGSKVRKGHGALNMPPEGSATVASDAGSSHGVPSRTGPSRPIWEAPILQVMRTVLHNHAISSEDTLGELGVSSLMAAVLVDAVAAACGRAPPLTMFTIDATATVLAEAMDNGAGALWQGASHRILRLHTDGTDDPFFYLHGDLESGGLYCSVLAQRIGAEVPFYGLPPCRLDQTSRILDVTELALEQLAVVRAMRPKGPYQLGGYCNGGVVAVEMARLLAQAGERVSALVLIDVEPSYPLFARCRRLTTALLCRGPSLEDRRLAVFRKFTNLSARLHELPRQGIRAQARALRSFLTTLGRGSHGESARALSAPASRRDILSAYMWVVAGFHARPAAERITLLLSEEYALRATDIVSRWKAVTGALEVHFIPGDHVQSVSRHGIAIGDHVRDTLAAVGRSGSR